MIDVTKPLELSDGRKATYLAASWSTHGAIRVQIDGDEMVRVFYLKDGTHLFDGMPNLRNVAEKPTLDLTAPVQTRDGRAARILCTDAAHDNYPVIAVVVNRNGKEDPEQYSLSGKYLREGRRDHEMDLVNVPPQPVREELFVNLGTTYSNEAAARNQDRFGWPVARVMLEDGKVASVEVLPADAENTKLKGYGTKL